MNKQTGNASVATMLLGLVVGLVVFWAAVIIGITHIVQAVTQ